VHLGSRALSGLSEDFAHEFEIAIICCLLFIGFIVVWIARRTYKSGNSD